MKKILLLGGSRYLIPVIKAAKELGLYVITCDYLPNNIAHKFSDKYVNVSIINKEAVLNVAKEEGVSGIMSFACDPGVVTAAYVAEKLGLPSCGSYESVSLLQNKAKFREFLKNNDFNVPEARGYSSYESAMKEVDCFRFPVIVKPTDSAGSKGVMRVDNITQLKDAIDNALKFSHRQEFIVEEFIEKKGCSSDSDCFSINGKLKFVTFSAQYFDENSKNPYTPAAYAWPSTFEKKNEDILKVELQRLLDLLEMKTSIYNIETRENINGVPYIMEVSPRGGGNRLSEMLKYSTGIDLIKATVKAAIGEDLKEFELTNYNGYWAEVILHAQRTGFFKKLTIKEDKNMEIIEKDLWIKRGEVVKEFTGANETIGTLVLKFKTMEAMDNYMKKIGENVIVEVE